MHSKSVHRRYASSEVLLTGLKKNRKVGRFHSRVSERTSEASMNVTVTHNDADRTAASVLQPRLLGFHENRRSRAAELTLTSGTRLEAKSTKSTIVDLRMEFRCQ